MRAAPDLANLLSTGRTLRRERGGVLSALPVTDTGALYDRRAAAYDRLVGNRRYNRVAWGTDSHDYGAFAAEAAGSGDGPFLDVGCGSATFTAAAYQGVPRTMVLVDRSLDMVARAGERITTGSVALVQADLFDLPFAPNRFVVVACFGVLHVLDDPWAALRALNGQIAPGGRLFASMLVADRQPGRGYLTALHRVGEVGPPRRCEELAEQARTVFGESCTVERTGSMAWLRATRD